jgi:hypothetical protein
MDAYGIGANDVANCFGSSVGECARRCAAWRACASVRVALACGCHRLLRLVCVALLTRGPAARTHTHTTYRLQDAVAVVGGLHRGRV